MGDELKEVNGISVDGKKPEEIIQILVSTYGMFESNRIFIFFFKFLWLLKKHVHVFK